MKPGHILRVVRPTDNLSAIVKMYVTGLGCTVIAQFRDHEGFDGTTQVGRRLRIISWCSSFRSGTSGRRAARTC